MGFCWPLPREIKKLQARASAMPSEEWVTNCEVGRADRQHLRCGCRCGCRMERWTGKLRPNDLPESEDPGLAPRKDSVKVAVSRRQNFSHAPALRRSWQWAYRPPPGQGEHGAARLGLPSLMHGDDQAATLNDLADPGTDRGAHSRPRTSVGCSALRPIEWLATSLVL